MNDDMTKYDKDLWRAIYKDIHTVGELMHDPLIWSFIPQHLDREVDMEWNGIGNWKA